MKEDKRYEIDVFKLKNGRYTYNFKVEDDFFEKFENSPVSGGKGDITIDLDKQENMIHASISISVAVPLICDRSLKDFSYLVEERKEIVYKYGEQEEEIDDELIVITRNTQRIDLSQLIYEFICIALPMRRIHPDHADDSDENELIYRSEESGKDQGNDGDDPVDPRWSKLKDLK